jgi:hypothetical protein
MEIACTLFHDQGHTHRQGAALHSDEERRPGGDDESEESEAEDRKVMSMVCFCKGTYPS